MKKPALRIVRKYTVDLDACLAALELLVLSQTAKYATDTRDRARATRILEATETGSQRWDDRIGRGTLT